MGYCMDMDEAEFVIEADRVDGALRAIKSLAGGETIRDGSGRHYSWVHTEAFLKATTLAGALMAWRWDATTEEDGSISGLSFDGEKLGDDEILFSAIAPYVKEGSYIQMRGECGALWRWVFDGKTVREVNASVVWPE